MYNFCINKILKYKTSYLSDFNSKTQSARQMNLVLFQEAIVHVLKISRILSLPLGSALLIGVGGSGRKSLATLASHIMKLEKCIV